MCKGLWSTKGHSKVADFCSFKEEVAVACLFPLINCHPLENKITQSDIVGSHRGQHKWESYWYEVNASAIKTRVNLTSCHMCHMGAVFHCWVPGLCMVRWGKCFRLSIQWWQRARFAHGEYRNTWWQADPTAEAPVFFFLARQIFVLLIWNLKKVKIYSQFFSFVPCTCSLLLIYIL